AGAFDIASLAGRQALAVDQAGAILDGVGTHLRAIRAVVVGAGNAVRAGILHAHASARVVALLVDLAEQARVAVRTHGRQLKNAILGRGHGAGRTAEP